MSIKLDAVAYRNRSEYRIERLEETILLLNVVVNKIFKDSETHQSYDRLIEEIRAELYNRRETPTQEI